MLISSSYIAELMGKKQVTENIIINVFELIEKYDIKTKDELNIYLEDPLQSGPFLRSIQVGLSELVRLKLIEMNKIEVRPEREYVELKLEQVKQRNDEALQQKDAALNFDIEL